MREVLLWVFVYIPIAVSIISFVLPIVLMCVGLFLERLTVLFKQQETPVKPEEKSISSEKVSKVNNSYTRENKNNLIICIVFILFVLVLFTVIGLTNSTHPSNDKKLRNTTYSGNSVVSQNTKNLQDNSRFYVDVSKITTEAELKQSMKSIYDTCVKANMAQPNSDDIDSQLFCECFVANFFYNLNSYGAQYILEYFSTLSQNEVNIIKKANKSKKAFMLPNLMSKYQQHLISDNVYETQRNIAAFTCFREISEDEDLLPEWLNTDKMAENLEKLDPYDKKFNQTTTEELLNNKQYEQMMQRNMVFSYNSCLKNMPSRTMEVFPEDFSKKLCHCITKNSFYFGPGVFLYNISSNINDLKKMSKTELVKESHKISNFNDFDVLYKSNKNYSSEPVYKKVEISNLTAAGGCMKWAVQDFLFDTEAVVEELFDKNDTE